LNHNGTQFPGNGGFSDQIQEEQGHLRVKRTAHAAQYKCFDIASNALMPAKNAPSRRNQVLTITNKHMANEERGMHLSGFGKPILANERQFVIISAWVIHWSRTGCIVKRIWGKHKVVNVCLPKRTLLVSCFVWIDALNNIFLLIKRIYKRRAKRLTQTLQYAYALKWFQIMHVEPRTVRLALALFIYLSLPCRCNTNCEG
jgi:hypothetical protein